MNILSIAQNSFFKNISWLVLEKIIRMGLNLLIMAAVANYLGVQGFGTLSYFMAIMFFFLPIWSMGTDQIIKNELTRSALNKNLLISTAMITRVCLALFLVLMITAYYLLFIGKGEGFDILFILTSSLVFKSASVIELWFDTQIKSRFNALARTISFVIIALLQILAIHLRAPLYIFALCFSLEFVFSALLIFYFYFIKEKNPICFQFDKTIAKSIIIKSLPLFFSELSATCFMKLNIVLLGYYMDKSTVGYFSIAVRLTDMWIFIPASIAITYFSPIVSLSMDMKDQVLFKKRNQDLFSYVTLIALGVGVFISFLGEPIVKLLFSKSYEESIGVLMILIWSNLFVFWGFAQEPWEISKNLLKYRLIRVLSGAILNLVLNIILIPKLGAKGAAYASLISHTWTYCLVNLVLKQTREVFMYQIKSLNILRPIIRAVFLR